MTRFNSSTELIQEILSLPRDKAGILLSFTFGWLDGKGVYEEVLEAFEKGFNYLEGGKGCGIV